MIFPGQRVLMINTHMKSNGFIYFQDSKIEMLEMNTFKTLSQHYFQPRIQDNSNYQLNLRTKQR